ncbi:hypothetical protein [Sneathiella limimaris]|nr:hypothetical protein [Sneathiella limimaris]
MQLGGLKNCKQNLVDGFLSQESETLEYVQISAQVALVRRWIRMRLQV